MNEDTTKKEFLDGYEVWLAPPNDVEGKEMIPLLLLGTQEAGSMNFVVNNATSVTSYVSNDKKNSLRKRTLFQSSHQRKCFVELVLRILKSIFVESVLTFLVRQTL